MAGWGGPTELAWPAGVLLPVKLLQECFLALLAQAPGTTRSPFPLAL